MGRNPFVFGFVSSAFLMGALIGGVIDPTLAIITAPLCGISAALSSMICLWKPGLNGSAIKLWLMSIVANPFALAGVAMVPLMMPSCGVWEVVGHGCGIAVLARVYAFVSIVSPLVGLAARRLTPRDS